MIRRDRELDVLTGLLRRHPVVGIIGARQVGKTTLARRLAAATKGPCAYFDLEDPRDLARLDDPMLALQDLRGLVVIDEVQQRPDLFPVLRVLVDRPRPRTRFLVLGSASPGLLHQGSESLAGRIIYHQLGGFALDEVGIENQKQLWLRGGFPRAYLARTHRQSSEWRHGLIRTILERELPQLGITARPTTMRRFWTMLAHYHAQTWNASEFARAFGVSDTTVRSYLDVMTSALMVRQLQPWHANISKRQVKAPKVYLSDSGILHALLDLEKLTDLEGHPKVGASWEGFGLDQIIRRLGARPDQCFFWATYAGAELDLLVVSGRRRLGFEFKRASAPTANRSIHAALKDLNLDRLDVIYPGERTFPLAAKVRAVGLARLLDDVEPL
ncbi:MAG: ATP-binding protein [Phycisphaerae bacterium]|nr:ATP-binding protein [Phycisphaerae bacterium]